MEIEDIFVSGGNMAVRISLLLKGHIPALDEVAGQMLRSPPPGLAADPLWNPPRDLLGSFLHRGCIPALDGTAMAPKH